MQIKIPFFMRLFQWDCFAPSGLAKTVRKMPKKGSFFRELFYYDKNKKEMKVTLKTDHR